MEYLRNGGIVLLAFALIGLVVPSNAISHDDYSGHKTIADHHDDDKSSEDSVVFTASEVPGAKSKAIVGTPWSSGGYEHYRKPDWWSSFPSQEWQRGYDDFGKNNGNYGSQYMVSPDKFNYGRGPMGANYGQADHYSVDKYERPEKYDPYGYRGYPHHGGFEEPSYGDCSKGGCGSSYRPPARPPVKPVPPKHQPTDHTSCSRGGCGSQKPPLPTEHYPPQHNPYPPKEDFPHGPFPAPRPPADFPNQRPYGGRSSQGYGDDFGYGGNIDHFGGYDYY